MKNFVQRQEDQSVLKLFVDKSFTRHILPPSATSIYSPRSPFLRRNHLFVQQWHCMIVMLEFSRLAPRQRYTLKVFSWFSKSNDIFRFFQFVIFFLSSFSVLFSFSFFHYSLPIFNFFYFPIFLYLSIIFVFLVSTAVFHYTSVKLSSEHLFINHSKRKNQKEDEENLQIEICHSLHHYFVFVL